MPRTHSLQGWVRVSLAEPVISVASGFLPHPLEEAGILERSWSPKSSPRFTPNPGQPKPGPRKKKSLEREEELIHHWLRRTSEEGGSENPFMAFWPILCSITRLVNPSLRWKLLHRCSSAATEAQ
ncbi:UNVERIFIED_CONTAM: hypothetical protein K2H54_032460 [Gekko kuhli]